MRFHENGDTVIDFTHVAAMVSTTEKTDRKAFSQKRELSTLTQEVFKVSVYLVGGNVIVLENEAAMEFKHDYQVFRIQAKS